jgi:hypothetical protein
LKAILNTCALCFFHRNLVLHPEIIWGLNGLVLREVYTPAGLTFFAKWAWINLFKSTIWLFSIAMENPNHKWRFRSLGKSSISIRAMA